MRKKYYIGIVLVIFISVIYVIMPVKNNFVADSDFVTNSKSHHTLKGFRNPYPGFEEQGFGDLIKWMLSRHRNVNEEQDKTVYSFETVKNDGSYLRGNHTDFTATWIGHSTVFIQLDGLNILTYPMWSERASPLTWAGPKRFVKPGISLDNLPEIDVVVITHNHYDHLDRQTIQLLGDRPLYFVPLGLGAFLKKLGISRYHEMDWWDSIRFGDVEFICVPSQHFSSRFIHDRNRTLWCSWVIRGNSGSVFFCGDSEYFPGFSEIGERYGPFDLACLPIGAYLPKWFMGPVHLSPKEAIQAFRDVRGRKFLAVHWGAFSLADDPPGLAPKVLVEEIREQNLNKDDFWLLKHGETRIVLRTLKKEEPEPQ